jgi:hypothetical protein
MNSRSIIKSKLRYKIIKKYLAKGLGLILVGASIGGLLSYSEKLGMRYDRKNLEKHITEEIFASAGNEINANKFLRPYLKENPSIIDKVPEDYEHLSTLNFLVNRPENTTTNAPNTNTTTSLEHRLSQNGAFSIQIDEDLYFGNEKLSDKLEYFPNTQLLWDKASSVLYHLSKERQRIETPIYEVSQVSEVNNETYILQRSNLLFMNQGKLEIKSSSVHAQYGLQNINGTPFKLAFEVGNIKLIGTSNNEVQEKLKTELEKLIEKYPNRSFKPLCTTKVIFNNHVLYFNDNQRIVILSPDSPTPLNLEVKGPFQKILDYVVTPCTNKQDKINSYITILQTEAAQDSAPCFFGVYNFNGLLYTIPSKFTKETRFEKDSPKNSQCPSWMFPLKLKETIKQELKIK